MHHCFASSLLAHCCTLAFKERSCFHRAFSPPSSITPLTFYNLVDVFFCWRSGLCELGFSSHCWLRGANISSCFRLCPRLFSDPFFSRPELPKVMQPAGVLLVTLVSSRCLCSYIYVLIWDRPTNNMLRVWNVKRNYFFPLHFLFQSHFWKLLEPLQVQLCSPLPHK